MHFYQSFLQQNKFDVMHLEAQNELADIRQLIPYLKQQNINIIHYFDPADYWLEKRISKSAKKHNIKGVKYDSPMFLNTLNDITEYFVNNSKLLLTNFFIEQRKWRDILLDENQNPLGSK